MFMVVQTYLPIYRKMRDKKAFDQIYGFDCHPLCYGDAQ